MSLTDGLKRISDIKHATQSSPPTVYKDLVIVGSQVPDRVQVPDPVGYVQAFNARTGKRVWTFSVIPQSPKDPGADTWENESWRTNGHGGGANWGGAAFDPETGYLFVRAANSVGVNRLAKNDGANPLVTVDYSNVFARGGESANLPGGLPLISPPYAVLTAVDLNKGEIAWKTPLGEGSPALRNHPLLKGVTLPDRLGSPNNLGGAMVTRSGLVFIGGGDGYFYAFDSK